MIGLTDIFINKTIKLGNYKIIKTIKKNIINSVYNVLLRFSFKLRYYK